MVMAEIFPYPVICLFVCLLAHFNSVAEVNLRILLTVDYSIQAAFPSERLGMGAFRIALESVFNR